MCGPNYLTHHKIYDCWLDSFQILIFRFFNKKYSQKKLLLNFQLAKKCMKVFFFYLWNNIKIVCMGNVEYFCRKLRNIMIYIIYIWCTYMNFIYSIKYMEEKQFIKLHVRNFHQKYFSLYEHKFASFLHFCTLWEYGLGMEAFISLF